VISPVSDLVEGCFREVMADAVEAPGVRRVVFCSGKVFYDLLARREELDAVNTALVRLEQLFPFPRAELAGCLEMYAQAKQFAWVQEEHCNYGAWTFVREQFTRHFPGLTLTYFGRRENPSSATGLFAQHQKEQQELAERVFDASRAHDDRGSPRS
jgi:2-oxoglutarate dehydrogenase E1 component